VGAKGASRPKRLPISDVDHCVVCTRRVYAAERLVAAGRLFHAKSAGHPGCFRCAHCDLPLKSSDFSFAGSKAYCATHFKQLFAQRGNYDFAEADAENNGQANGQEASPVSPTSPSSRPSLRARAPSFTLESPSAIATGEDETPPPMVLPTARSPTNTEARQRSNTRPRQDTIASSTAVLASSVSVGAGEEVDASAEEEDEGQCYMYGDLEIPFVVEEGWLRMRDVEEAQNWLLVSYALEQETCIEVVGEGQGGLAECLALASAGRVYWGGLRVVAVDTRRGVVSRRPKFVFFMLADESTPLKVKARGLLHMGAIQEVMQQAHVSIEAESVDELTQDIIIAKLLQCGGAHKPNAWDFGAGVLVESEWY